jgi:exodeoxyribonuclease VIII
MTMANGCYRLTYAEYDAIEAVRMSDLSNIDVSPKHYQHKLSNRQSSAALELGNATDVAVFEPELFVERYVFWQTTTTDGKTRQRRGNDWEDFKRLHDDKIIITSEQYNEALDMRIAIASDPLAWEYLEHGSAQDSLIWTDEETGLLCKARLDWRCTGGKRDGALLDLKTARSVLPWLFNRAIGEYHYHAKMAFYADAYEIVFQEPPSEVVLLAVESSGCHDVVVYDMREDESTLDEGRIKYRGWLNTLVECRESGKWPGIGRGEKVAACLPKYKRVIDDSDLGDLDLEVTGT